MYYLSYAIDHDFVSEDSHLVADVTFAVIACSLLVHTNAASIIGLLSSAGSLVMNYRY